MKTYTTISQINTYKKLSQIKCDICGMTTNNEWNESKYDNNDVTIELQKDDVEFAKALQVSEDTIYIGDFAKLLNQQGLNIGRNELFEHMRKYNLVIKERATVNTPTQKAMEMRLLELEEKVYYNNQGKEKISLTTRITPKGQKYLIKKMTKNNTQTEMFA